MVTTLLKEEPNVPLLVDWAKQRKVLPPVDTKKGSQIKSEKSGLKPS